MEPAIFNDGPLIKMVLEWTSIIMFVIFFAIFTTLFVLKQNVERKALSVEDAKNYYLNFLHDMGQKSSWDFMPINSVVRRYGFTAAIEDYYNNRPIRDARVTELISSSDIVAYYQKQAKSRSWAVRSFAYLQLSRLGLPGMKQFFYASADMEQIKKRSEKAFAICLYSAALLCDTPEDFKKILALLQKDQMISGGFQEGILVYAGKTLKSSLGDDKAFTIYQDALHDIPPSEPVMIALVAAAGKLGFRQVEQLLGYLYEMAGERQAILKVACLRSFGELKKGRMFVERSLTDADWRVRSTGARVAIAFVWDEFIEPLKKCLTDSNYYVRLNAARSLAGMDVEGSVLTQAMNDTDDLYSKEMSHYALSGLPGHA